MLICIQENIKLAIFVVIFISVISCQSSHKIPTSTVSESNAQDTTWKNEQKALADWLLSQPQEVRDAFKRDFTFSKQQIDSLKSSIGDTIREINRDTTTKY
jgi:hypothetical protein